MIETNLQQEWDERYAAAEELFSGKPNTVLVAEVGDLPPGRALDVGCGEGADAVWLASRGWAVTGLDVSRVALERAADRATEAGVEVTFIHDDLVSAELPAAGFDLVTAQYPALRSSADRAAERAITAAVAPGGVLLVVHHTGFDGEEAKARGFDPADYVFPADVRTQLGDGWDVRFEESRPRATPLGGQEQRHTHDAVLFARRLH
ncbi:class I SAM-dependent methyltransferase [Mycolicibacterium sp. S2-37]|uniref:class I SAM-dependent methyltransferase n=1 Tax=Mycolicibacterium sp. S2-37 TaxID=2810297 RepID=UPI001A951ADA|nr:class I SAM-dependent methyltransferase [Mycolicibacterium sp. S2-37]MBO0677392.1 class I SAM-dependent methyltransferase [Mycolicibacterium sp. S2-37]